jgi:hypothetical protein
VFTIHSIVAPFLNKLPATVKQVAAILRPEIERRRTLMDKYGKDYPEKTVNLTNIKDKDHSYSATERLLVLDDGFHLW